MRTHRQQEVGMSRDDQSTGALEGRVAIVTGANHGIGAATASNLASSGASVLLTYLRLPVIDGIDDGTRLRYAHIRATARAEDVAAEIRSGGGVADAIEADLADPATVRALFDRAEELFGPVDLLVNNADHCSADTFLPAGAMNAELS